MAERGRGRWRGGTNLSRMQEAEENEDLRDPPFDARFGALARHPAAGTAPQPACYRHDGPSPVGASGSTCPCLPTASPARKHSWPTCTLPPKIRRVGTAEWVTARGSQNGLWPSGSSSMRASPADGGCYAALTDGSRRLTCRLRAACRRSSATSVVAG